MRSTQSKNLRLLRNLHEGITSESATTRQERSVRQEESEMSASLQLWVAQPFLTFAVGKFVEPAVIQLRWNPHLSVRAAAEDAARFR